MLKTLVLFVVILEGIYSFILNVVKYRSANNPTPQSVADVYDAETYGRWKKYSAAHCCLAMASSVASCLISIILLITNVYASFAALFGSGVFWQLFSVLLLETIVGFFVETIQSYISTMVIEEKYGFNRSTIKTFLTDRIRSLIIGLILSLGLVGGLAAIHSWLGDWMILAFAVAVFAVVLAISFLYPVFSRLGNKFVPLEEGELKERLTALLEKHGYSVKAIEVMDASRRTTKLNAYFTGFGKMKTIVLFDNLVNTMPADEICAVFAHELGHGLNKDVLKGQVLSFFNMLILSTVAWLVVRTPEIYTEFGFFEVNYGFSYILIGVFLSLINPLISIVFNWRSRSAEYRADRQAVQEGYGEAMITALKRLAKDNFAHLAPSRLNVVLEYSHPPLSRRIEEVEKEIARQNTEKKS